MLKIRLEYKLPSYSAQGREHWQAGLYLRRAAHVSFRGRLQCSRISNGITAHDGPVSFISSLTMSKDIGWLLQVRFVHQGERVCSSRTCVSDVVPCFGD